jgi:ABC-2 type transport system permease protein
VSYWPDAVQAIANILPLTYGLAAVRLLFDGGSAKEVIEQTGKGLLVASLWFGLAMILIDRMADAGRQDGSIEFV